MKAKRTVNKSEYNFKYDSEIIFLVGNIGSGKSTYVKTLNGSHMVLSRDNLRYMIGGGEYVFMKDIEHIIWDAQNALFCGLMETGVNIVIDDVNTNLIARRIYLQDVLHGYKTKAIVLPRIPMEEAVARRMGAPHGSCSKDVWELVWNNFNNQYIDPTVDEGFDEVIHVKSKMVDGKVIFEEECPLLKRKKYLTKKDFHV